MDSFKRWANKFGENNISKDKETINAIVMSDRTFSPHNKFKKYFSLVMWSYALLIFVITILSLTSLAFSESFVDNHKGLITTLEGIVFIILLIDLVMRWYTSEVRIRKGNWSFFIFPFTFNGMLLIISLLPSLYIINVWSGESRRVFTTFENMKFLRIFRIVLLANILPGVRLFRDVIKKEKSTLYVVFLLVGISILLFALVVYNIEQGIDANGLSAKDKGWDHSTVHFKTFWDALYFSTITLTTIGFGDKYPVTHMGQIVTMVMSILGIAVLAVPSGVIAGGFISELKSKKNNN